MFQKANDLCKRTWFLRFVGWTIIIHMNKNLHYNCTMLFHFLVPSRILIHTCACMSNLLRLILISRSPTYVSLGSISIMFTTPKPCNRNIKNPMDGFCSMHGLSNLWTIWCSNNFWIVRFWFYSLLLEYDIFYASLKPILILHQPLHLLSYSKWHDSIPKRRYTQVVCTQSTAYLWSYAITQQTLGIHTWIYL